MTMTINKPRVSATRKALVLKTVQELWRKRKMPCTFDEIATRAEISRSSAFYAVQELAAGGMLLYDRKVGRSVRPRK